MALQPTSGENQVFYNDVTNQYHLVNVAPDNTKTDLGAITDNGVISAIEALPLDSTTGALITIDSPHHEIHEGESFFINHVDATPTNTGEQSMIAFKTHATTRVHILYKGVASAAAHFHVFEGVGAGSAGGTDVVVYNHERDDVTASTMRRARSLTAARVTTYVAADSTNITGRTTLSTEAIGATGQGQNTTGGDVRAFGELILAADTVYSFAIESLDNNTNTHQIFLTWYEES